MKKFTFLLLVAVFSFAISSCENDNPKTEDLNYIGFESTSFNFPVDIDGTTEQMIKVYTTNKTGSDRSFAISIDIDLSTADPSSYTVPSSVTIPANTNMGEIPVIISDINIGVAGKTLVLKFTQEQDLYTSDDIALSVVQSCPGNEVFLDMTFDNWGSETSWELLDSSDNTVASGGGYSDGDSGYSTSFCLGVGTYTYTVYDAYGDGGATTTITKNDETLVSISGGDYATEISADFEIK